MVQLETARDLATAMAAEIACFEAYIATQKSFSSAIRERDWTSLQTAMSIMEDLARAIAARESLRADLFERLRARLGCEAGGLYRLALLLPEPERSELTDLYRRLKITAMRARFENASAGDLSAGNRDLLKAVIEELFPEKKVRIYGKSGRALQSESGALVLDAAL